MANLEEQFFKFFGGTWRSWFCKNKYSKTIFLKTLRKGKAVFLRTPDHVPQKVMDDLSSVFEKHENILLAYVAVGFLEEEEPPHYIVGIKIDPQAGVTIEQLMMSTLGKEFNEVIPKGFYVDILEINDKDTDINNFMKNYLIPFYTREARGPSPT